MCWQQYFASDAWVACNVIHGFVTGLPWGLDFPCLEVSPHNWRRAHRLRTWQQTCWGKQLSRDTLSLSATVFSICPLDARPISKALIWCSDSSESYWLLCEAVPLLCVAALYAWSGRATQMTQHSQWLGSIHWSSLVHEEKGTKSLPHQGGYLHPCVTSLWEWECKVKAPCSCSYAFHLKNKLIFPPIRKKYTCCCLRLWEERK